MFSLFIIEEIYINLIFYNHNPDTKYGKKSLCDFWQKTHCKIDVLPQEPTAAPGVCSAFYVNLEIDI
uniref:Uncharacterized protein n=1 Tax=Strongyloides papillosus TaxID=174720 RepID=A0A0N5BTL5_STREA